VVKRVKSEGKVSEVGEGWRGSLVLCGRAMEICDQTHNGYSMPHLHAKKAKESSRRWTTDDWGPFLSPGDVKKEATRL